MTWINTAFFAVFDIALASVFAYFSGPGEKVVIFFAVLAALWVLPAAIGIWTLFKFWVGYHLFLKERLVRFYLADFNKHKFPSSRAYFDHMSYASNIFDDEDLDITKKLRASYLLGEMAGYKSVRYFTMGMATEFAFQEAMHRYKSNDYI